MCEETDYLDGVEFCILDFDSDCHHCGGCTDEDWENDELDY